MRSPFGNGPKEHFFAACNSPAFEQKGPAAHQAPQGRIACRRQNMAAGLVGRRRQHAYGREQPLNTPRIPQRTQTPPRTVSRLQRYMRYIINDLRRPPALPAAHGLSGPARRVPPLFRQTRRLPGCFRPPMRRLRAEIDAIAHARDNSRPSDGCRALQAFGPAGASWPFPNPRLEHRPQLVRNPAFFASAAGKADAPLFYAR